MGRSLLASPAFLFVRSLCIIFQLVNFVVNCLGEIPDKATACLYRDDVMIVRSLCNSILPSFITKRSKSSREDPVLSRIIFVQVLQTSSHFAKSDLASLARNCLPIFDFSQMILEKLPSSREESMFYEMNKVSSYNFSYKVINDKRREDTVLLCQLPSSRGENINL
jgi:hypothetical protein